MKAVLFLHIGWASIYDGSELVQGGHKYLKEYSDECGESTAFLKGDDGAFSCFAGRGHINESTLDVVFVARDPSSRAMKVVGLYKDATQESCTNIEKDGVFHYAIVRTDAALLFPVARRIRVKDWPGSQGMRRWAKRIDKTGDSHAHLYALYRSMLSRKESPRTEDDLDDELAAFEGEQRRRFVLHRRREARLRAAKIRKILSDDGRLRCEVPGCGFDFEQVYGEIGSQFAVVHHLVPLSKTSKNGKENTLDDLAIVCANCHAMIHRGGECRSLDGLIEAKDRD